MFRCRIPPATASQHLIRNLAEKKAAAAAFGSWCPLGARGRRFTPSSSRSYHSTSSERVAMTPEGSRPQKPSVEEARIQANKYFPEFNLQNKVIIVTGGGRGLGLTVAEALFQGGAIVHCLDRLDKPEEAFLSVQRRTDFELGGELHYHGIDVRDTEALHNLIGEIAAQRKQLDGLFGAAGILHEAPALEYTAEDTNTMLSVNYTALFMTAQGCAREMKRYGNGGSLVLVASMSGIVANKGLKSPVYNSTKAAVNQLVRNLAMEWAPLGIRVNSVCPGHVVTPMVQQYVEEKPDIGEIWNNESMMKRIGRPEEFRGAAVYLLSDASSFQTASQMVIDGGHTAW